MLDVLRLPGRTALWTDRLPGYGPAEGEIGPADPIGDTEEECMATITARRRRAVEHLIVTDFARDRLARAAFDVIADGLDLGPCAIRTQADRAWVREAISGPIQRAADHALDKLVVELIDRLVEGRPDLVGRLLAPAGEAGELEAELLASTGRLVLV